MELVKASEYGIEEKKANELTSGLTVHLKEREALLAFRRIPATT